MINTHSNMIKAHMNHELGRANTPNRYLTHQDSHHHHHHHLPSTQASSLTPITITITMTCPIIYPPNHTNHTYITLPTSVVKSTRKRWNVKARADDEINSFVFACINKKADKSSKKPTKTAKTLTSNKKRRRAVTVNRAKSTNKKPRVPKSSAKSSRSKKKRLGVMPDFDKIHRRMAAQDEGIEAYAARMEAIQSFLQLP